MNPTLNPTNDQLQARLNPQAVDVQTPASAGFFRSSGDFGSTLYKKLDNGRVQAINLIGDNSPLFNGTEDRVKYGNAGGQAQEALNRLKTKYGVDYNSLNQVNIGDLYSTMNKDANALQRAGFSGPTGFQIDQGGSDFFGNAVSASLGRTSLNTEANKLASTPSTNPPTGSYAAATVPSYTGNSIVDFLNSSGQASDFNSRAALASKYGISNYTGTADQNMALLNNMRGAPQPFSIGSVNPSMPFNLNSGQQSTFDTSALDKGLTTQDVMSKRQSYEDTITNYLKSISQAQAAVNNTKASELQNLANSMYGLNGAGGADTPLQGLQLQQYNREQAFKTVPAEIALSNAQNALALYKQSPEYITQNQALSTAYNLLQSYPDIQYQYNPNVSPQQNLQAIQAALPSSQRYQASLVSTYTNPLTGNVGLINKAGGQVGGSSIGGGIQQQSTGGQQAPVSLQALPTEVRAAVANTGGTQYIDMGKLNTSQIPTAQRVSANTGIPLLSKEDANKVQEAYAAFNGADALISQIANLSKNVITANANAASQTAQLLRLKAIEFAPSLSTDSQAKQFVSSINSMLSLISRASGERGVLTDQDVNRIKNALPSYGDDKETAQNKVNQLSTVMRSAFNAAIDSYVGKKGSVSPQVSQPAAGTTANGVKWTIEK